MTDYMTDPHRHDGRHDSLDGYCTAPTLRCPPNMLTNVLTSVCLLSQLKLYQRRIGGKCDKSETIVQLEGHEHEDFLRSIRRLATPVSDRV